MSSAAESVSPVQPVLVLSAAAREAARRDLRPGEMLRIAFAGGCGALGFRIAPSRVAREGDLRLELDGVVVLLDQRGAAELAGAILDHDDDQGFRLDHPAWGVSC